MRALSRLAAVAAILLIAVLATTAVAAAHPGHGSTGPMPVAGQDHALGDHGATSSGGPDAILSADMSAAFLAKGCAGACCAIACSMTCAGSALGPSAIHGAVPDPAAARYAIGHAATAPDAPARRHPKPPRA
jgi:hypothetical protein